jgi:hypothetical protein
MIGHLSFHGFQGFVQELWVAQECFIQREKFQPPNQTVQRLIIASVLWGISCSSFKEINLQTIRNSMYHCQPAEQTMKMGNKISNIHEVESISFAPETLRNQITLSPMPKQWSKVPHFQEGTFPKHIYGTSPAYSTTTLHSIKVTQQMSAVIHTFKHVAHKASAGHLNHEQQCQAL